MKEHFSDILNRPPPADPPEWEAGPPKILEPARSQRTKTELLKVIKNLKTGKAGSIDNIPPGAISCQLPAYTKLLNKIWNDEQIQDDWCKGQCNNFKGITLLSIPCKILRSKIIERMKHDIDKPLREEQAGFRKTNQV